MLNNQSSMMSDTSSDEELSSDWIPYFARKNWVDIIPLPQDEGERPIVAIGYNEKFKDVYGYFRAILAKREISMRALELTKDAVNLNTANYTVWQYRRDILKELGCDLYAELDFIKSVIKSNSKNYQVWHHRRVIVEWLSDPSQELLLTEDILNLDSKNYHAWQHRQWVIQRYGLFEEELQYVERLIAVDVRNNSAWNQRFFVLNHFGFTHEVVKRELSYALSRLEIVKNNESVWNFLKGLLKQTENPLIQFPEVLEYVEGLYNGGNRSPLLISFLIDLYGMKLLEPTESEQNGYRKKSLALCTAMATKHDIIRRKYWNHIAKNL